MGGPLKGPLKIAPPNSRIPLEGIISEAPIWDGMSVIGGWGEFGEPPQPKTVQKVLARGTARMSRDQARNLTCPRKPFKSRPMHPGRAQPEAGRSPQRKPGLRGLRVEEALRKLGLLGGLRRSWRPESCETRSSWAPSACGRSRRLKARGLGLTLLEWGGPKILLQGLDREGGMDIRHVVLSVPDKNE